MGEPQGWSNNYISYDPFSQLHNPFLYSLDLPDLSNLKNDLIRNDPWWSSMPMKLPSDIPKFEENLGDYTSTHITTYHF